MDLDQDLMDIRPESMMVEIVRREAWQAAEPRPRRPWDKPIPRLYLPATYVFFAYIRKDYAGRRDQHTPGPHPEHSECLEELRFIQQGDMQKLPDIRYNFLIGGGNGIVYEGRGWYKRPTLPRKYNKFDRSSIYVSFLGDFRDEDPSEEAFKSKEEFLRYGVKRRAINPKFLELFITNKTY